MEKIVRHKKARLHGYVVAVKGLDKIIAIRRLRRSNKILPVLEVEDYYYGNDIFNKQISACSYTSIKI